MPSDPTALPTLITARPATPPPPPEPAPEPSPDPVTAPAAGCPLTDRFHAPDCKVCTPAGPADGDGADRFVARVAAAVARDHATVPAAAFTLAGALTPAERRLFDGERDRLIRLLDARVDGGGPDPAKLVAGIVLLDDIAGQVPALDDAIRADDARRDRDDADRPRVASVLTYRSAAG